MKKTKQERGRRGGLFLWLFILAMNATAATYEYDSLNRLTLVRYDATNMIYYAYDTVGNRTSRVRIGPDNPNLDSNTDGVSDRWELNYFGTLQVDLNADPDGDGLSNLEEYLLGKDTTVFDNWRFGPCRALTNGSVEFTVIGKPGGSFTLESSTNLINWTKVGDFYCTGTNTFTVSSPQLKGREFFRFVVRSSPAPITLGVAAPPTGGSGPVLVLVGEQGRSYTVLVSPDLLTWLPLTNFISTQQITLVSDPAAINLTRRFYRAVSQ
jgi:hypothetical protein